jgi:N-acetylglucosaminyldiphosphoundecaprenol N-acetyl-beta-D-mannosaminyltransferase
MTILDTNLPASKDGHLNRPRVLGMHVDHIEFPQAVQTITTWGAATQAAGGHARARMVCAANVHMVMTAHDDADFMRRVNSADLVVPDGQPMVWALRLAGVPQRRRVRVAPDLILHLMSKAERDGLSVGLYGGTPSTLPALRRVLAHRYPSLHVPYAWAPPFRQLSEHEDAEVVAAVNGSGVHLLLVGLGCPKQECWMAEHRASLACVMLGVGAAFDLLSGRTSEAPPWSRSIGLEWTFRVAQEPRRLWRRHLANDPRFVTLLAADTWRRRMRA